MGLLLGTAEVRAVEEGGPWVARLLAGWVGPYLGESAVTKLEWAASVGEYYHWLPLAAERLHQLTVVRETLRPVHGLSRLSDHVGGDPRQVQHAGQHGE